MPRRYALVLRRAGGRCAFVLRTNDGLPLCGLGSLAPSGCWSSDVPPDPAALQVHARVAASWNAYAGRWPRTAGLDLEDVGRYLLDAGAVLLDHPPTGAAAPGRG